VILPDVNVLAYAFRRESTDHDRYAAWLHDLVAGADDLGLVEATLLGFVRIVTNPRIYADPAPTGDALRFVNALRGAPRARPLLATEATWTELTTLAAHDRQIRGNLVPDAWLAALATTHGCRLATADRGFSRFPRLDWFDPAQP
jgi:toxin-antitoxin system PIN domain toxin